jgi:hypothetical protein
VPEVFLHLGGGLAVHADHAVGGAGEALNLQPGVDIAAGDLVEVVVNMNGFYLFLGGQPPSRIHRSVTDRSAAFDVSKISNSFSVK